MQIDFIKQRAKHDSAIRFHRHISDSAGPCSTADSNVTAQTFVDSKQNLVKALMSFQTTTDVALPKYLTASDSVTSIRNSRAMQKRRLFESTEIDGISRPANAEPSTASALQGMQIEFR
jgi:hypothetical protein